MPKITLPQSMAPKLLTRYEEAREASVQKFGLLRSEDLARAVHSTAEHDSRVVSKWCCQREIFAVSYGGRLGYFAFQFDPLTGYPKPGIAEIFAAISLATGGSRIAL